MRLNRFFATGNDLSALRAVLSQDNSPGTKIELTEDDLIKQLRVVLSFEPGQRFIFLDDGGRACELEIERLEKTCLHCLISKILPAPEAPALSVSAGLALTKADRFEWALEKLTELGVSEIVPLLTRHCVARIDDDAKGGGRLEGKLSRWRSILKEAAEQSERATIPHIVKPQKLNDYLRSTSGGMHHLNYFCAERSGVVSLVKALSSEISNVNVNGAKKIEYISFVIGPEGGFALDELQSAEELGWKPVSLGKGILRSETAAIVAMSQIASVIDI